MSCARENSHYAYIAASSSSSSSPAAAAANPVSLYSYMHIIISGFTRAGLHGCKNTEPKPGSHVQMYIYVCVHTKADIHMRAQLHYIHTYICACHRTVRMFPRRVPPMGCPIAREFNMHVYVCMRVYVCMHVYVCIQWDSYNK